MNDTAPHLFASSLRRLHRDERGTTITEFVIVLPVFVLIFSATLALSKVQHVGIETQISASADMWDKAIAIQTSTDPMPDPNHMSAALGGQDAESLVSSRAQASSSQNLMITRWQRAQEDGHMGEAQAMLEPIQTYMPANFGLDSYSKLYSAHSRYGESTMTLSGSVGTIFDPNSKRAAFNLLNDATNMQALPSFSIQQASNDGTLYPLLDTVTPEGTIYRNAASMTGSSRIAIATGLRYGIAQGKSEVDVIHPMLPGSPTLSAGFDTLIAPKAQQTDEERARSNYISHMTLMNETLYSTLLGIEFEEKFEFDDSY